MRLPWDSVRAYPSDVLGLIEPFPDQAAELWAEVGDRYPFHYRATGGGLSLFSRYPIVHAETLTFESPQHHLRAILDIQGTAVEVIVTHPILPVNPSYFNQRNQVINALATYAHQHMNQKSIKQDNLKKERPLIIMGDFNTTSWSIYLRNFVNNSGLRNASLGHGIHLTWFYAKPSNRPSADWLFRFVKIPIDYIFVSPSIQVDEVTALPSGVSDHRPLRAKIRV